MPYFDYDGEIDIDVDDFLNACSSSEIKEIISALIEDGHLPKSLEHTNDLSNCGVAESEFEDALNKLHGKWVVLSKEEEEVIIKMSKRF